MNRRYLVPVLAILLLGSLLVWLLGTSRPAGGPPAPHQVLDLAATPRGGDFRLQGPRGPVSLADLRGRVVLLYFGYTWCPDICPTNLALLALALRGLTPAERAGVQVLFVSVDPARDSIPRLAEYSAYFHPDILGLTGSDAQIALAAARYGAAYRRVEQPDSAMGYAVDHSANTYVIDPAGRLVETLAHATPAEQVQAAIRRHLPPAGSGPAPGAHGATP